MGSNIVYYTESRVFVCKCGHAWYATKLFPQDYVNPWLQCHKCYHYSKVRILEGFANVKIESHRKHAYLEIVAKPSVKREVYCKRCEEWFGISNKVQKQALCPKCGIMTNMNYAKDTGKYREWETWE